MTTRINNPYQTYIFDTPSSSLQPQQQFGMELPQYNVSSFFEANPSEGNFQPYSEDFSSPSESYWSVYPHTGPECAECIQTIQFLSQKVFELEHKLYQFYAQNSSALQPPSYWAPHRYSLEPHQYNFMNSNQLRFAYSQPPEEELVNEGTSHSLSEPINSSSDVLSNLGSSEPGAQVDNHENVFSADDDVDDDVDYECITEPPLTELSADDLIPEESKSISQKKNLKEPLKSLAVRTEKKTQESPKKRPRADLKSKQDKKSSQVVTKTIQNETSKTKPIYKNNKDDSKENLLLEDFERKGESLLKNHESKKYAYETPIEDVLNDFIDLVLKGENSACFMKEFYEGLDTPKTSKAIIEELKRNCKPLKSENLRQYLQQLKSQNKQLCLINRITKECNLLV